MIKMKSTSMGCVSSSSSSASPTTANSRPRKRAATEMLDGGDEETTLSISVDSPLRNSNRERIEDTRSSKRHRRLVTWHLNVLRSKSIYGVPDPVYESLTLSRILTRTSRPDPDSIQTVLCLCDTEAPSGTSMHKQVVAKILSTRRDSDPEGSDRTWCLTTECEATMIMSNLVTRRVAPGLIETFGAYYTTDSIHLPSDDSDSRWRDINETLRTFSTASESPHRSFAVMVSEFVEDGLAFNFMGTLGARQNMPTPGHMISRMYGQLQWTLAAIHGLRLIHADVQYENVLLRRVPVDAHAVFDMPSHDVRYRFLSGGNTITTTTTPGNEPALTIMLKLADYGITEVRGTELLTVPTARYARPPEFFGAFNPIAPDHRMNGHLYKKIHAAADVWSSAMVFMTILCGGIVPGFSERKDTFHGVNYETGTTPQEYTSFQIPESFMEGAPWTAPSGFVMAFMQQIHRWKRAAKDAKASQTVNHDEISMLSAESSRIMANELWRFAVLLGVPTEEQWPDMKHMPLMRLLRAYDPGHHLEDAPSDVTVMPRRLAILYNAAIDTFAPDMSTQDRADLGTLLSQQLQWNPGRRPRPHVVLAHPIMKRLCRAETISGNTSTAPTTTWSLDIDSFNGSLKLAENDPLVLAVDKFQFNRS